MEPSATKQERNAVEFGLALGWQNTDYSYSAYWSRTNLPSEFECRNPPLRAETRAMYLPVVEGNSLSEDRYELHFLTQKGCLFRQPLLTYLLLVANAVMHSQSIFLELLCGFYLTKCTYPV